MTRLCEQGVFLRPKLLNVKMVNRDSFYKTNLPRLLDFLGLVGCLVIRNRRRYVIIIITIAAGIAGILTIVGIGDSVETQIGEYVHILGECTIITVDALDFGKTRQVDYGDLDLGLLWNTPNVLCLAPTSGRFLRTAYHGKEKMQITLTGVDENFWKTVRAFVRLGRSITREDVITKSLVCVLGEGVAGGLFGRSDPVGKFVSMQGLDFRVVGVLGGVQENEMRNTVYVPISSGVMLDGDMKRVNGLRVRVNSWLNVDDSKKALLGKLKTGLPGYEDSVRIHDYPERIKRAINTVRLVRTLGSLGLALAIILAAACLTGLMSMAVMDRTREIGLKKCLGATDRIIRVQFLGESIIVTFLGGLAGVGLGWMICLVTAAMAGLKVSFPVLAFSSLIAIFGATVLGIASGLYPAVKASRLDPVQSLRFE